MAVAGILEVSASLGLLLPMIAPFMVYKSNFKLSPRYNCINRACDDFTQAITFNEKLCVALAIQINTYFKIHDVLLECQGIL